MTDVGDEQTNSSSIGADLIGAVPGSESGDTNLLSFEERSGLFSSKHPAKETGDKIITARGNEHGLVLRIDGRAEWDLVVREVRLFLGGKRRFFEGGEISIEWLDAMPSRDRCVELETMLLNEFGVQVPRRGRAVPLKEVTSTTSRGSISSGSTSSGSVDELDLDEMGPVNTASNHDNRKKKAPGKRGNLFSGSIRNGSVPGSSDSHKFRDDWEDGLDRDSFVIGDPDMSSSIGGFVDSSGDSSFDREYVARVAKLLGDDMGQEEEANAKLVFGTLRSGQRVETPYSLIVVGDVNPGADLIAGGDIIVLGSLRGTAHASAYDDEFQDRIIIALHMHPMQLRIGTIISRGGEDGGRGPEIAHIEERRIVVEGFNSRILQRRRGRI